jgi:tetratricopeptide (TPR) repeat protein
VTAPPAPEVKPPPKPEVKPEPAPEPKVEPKPEPAPAKLPAPTDAEQVQIGQRLEQQLGFSKAQTEADKLGFAMTFFDRAAKPGVLPAERFVLLRLAQELAEAAGRPGNTPLNVLLNSFEINALALTPPLLPRLKPADPVKQLLVEALQLMAEDKDREAGVKLDEASRAAPKDARPRYLQGLMQYKTNNFAKSRELFESCSTDEDVAMRVRAFNALGLAWLWENKLGKAVDAFENAAKLSKPNTPPELAQNVGRLSNFKSNPESRQAALIWKEPQLVRDFSRLCKDTNATSAFDPAKGWLIMPLLDADGKTLGGIGLDRFEDRRCHVCAGRGCLRCRGTRIEFSLIRPEDIQKAREAGMLPGQPPIRRNVGQAPGPATGGLGQPQNPNVPAQPQQ